MTANKEMKEIQKTMNFIINGVLRENMPTEMPYTYEEMKNCKNITM